MIKFFVVPYPSLFKDLQYFSVISFYLFAYIEQSSNYLEGYPPMELAEDAGDGGGEEWYYPYIIS